MSIVALTNFVTYTRNGRVVYRFQNSQPGEILTSFVGVGPGPGFEYLSFIYQGAAKSRSGDNLEANIVMANNPISMNHAIDAVRGRWQAKIETAVMDPETFATQRILTTEYWIVANLAYNPETIELTLSSSIDAVGTAAPTRVLTRELVGNLPTTAQIRNV